MFASGASPPRVCVCVCVRACVRLCVSLLVSGDLKPFPSLPEINLPAKPPARKTAQLLVNVHLLYYNEISQEDIVSSAELYIFVCCTFKNSSTFTIQRFMRTFISLNAVLFVSNPAI